MKKTRFAPICIVLSLALTALQTPIVTNAETVKAQDTYSATDSNLPEDVVDLIERIDALEIDRLTIQRADAIRTRYYMLSDENASKVYNYDTLAEKVALAQEKIAIESDVNYQKEEKIKLAEQYIDQISYKKGEADLNELRKIVQAAEYFTSLNPIIQNQVKNKSKLFTCVKTLQKDHMETTEYTEMKNYVYECKNIWYSNYLDYTQYYKGVKSEVKVKVKSFEKGKLFAADKYICEEMPSGLPIIIEVPKNNKDLKLTVGETVSVYGKFKGISKIKATSEFEDAHRNKVLIGSSYKTPVIKMVYSDADGELVKLYDEFSDLSGYIGSLS